jgi:hypothetical protein
MQRRPSSYFNMLTTGLLAFSIAVSLPSVVHAQGQNLPPMNDGSSSFYSPGGNSNGAFTSYGQNNAPNTYSNNYNAYGQNYGNGANPALQGYVATAPAGTSVNASINSPLSSEFAHVGDRFIATLSAPLMANGSVLLPAGSQVEGQVVMVRSAGRTGRNGELEVRFNTSTLPNGQRLPLMAHVQTEDNSGIIRGGTNKGRMGRALVNTGVASGIGAALGTAMGPLSGGGVGRGAIFGTALGAGAGALGSAWQKGKPAVLDHTQPLVIVLDQPLTASPTSGGNGGYNGNSNYQPYNSNY